MQRLPQRAHLFAKIDPRGAQRLAQAHHLGAEVGAHARDRVAVLGDLFGEEADLPAHLGELPEDFLAQRVQPSAESGDRLEHQLEAHTELFEQRAYPVHMASSDTGLLCPLRSRSYPTDHCQTCSSVSPRNDCAVSTPRPIYEHRAAFDLRSSFTNPQKRLS